MNSPGLEVSPLGEEFENLFGLPSVISLGETCLYPGEVGGKEEEKEVEEEEEEEEEAEEEEVEMLQLGSVEAAREDCNLTRTQSRTQSCAKRKGGSTMPTSPTRARKLSLNSRQSPEANPPAEHSKRRPSASTRKNSSQGMARELLTEDEKRANHIASEQKRRNAIRLGYSELTEIVPALRDANYSKSVVLSKAVGYIKQLEKQTAALRDKVATMELRVGLEQEAHGKSGIPQHLFPALAVIGGGCCGASSSGSENELALTD
ncbi:uncharacterized protein VTP21DRAFT_89 [Calcarisporiella thermophila]|uniref:uncharacterized protein n=1 Tax=Calcarisporiella thermophila TaxID=911321 RepID=UPI0037427F5B